MPILHHNRGAAGRLALAGKLLLLLGCAGTACAGSEVRIGVFALFKPHVVRLRAAPGSLLRLEVSTPQTGTRPAARSASRSVRCSPSTESGLPSTLEGFESAEVRLRGRELEVAAKGRSVAACELRAAVNGAGGGLILSIPGKIERTFSGAVLIGAGDSNLIVSVAMDLETAVASAVLAESLPAAPLEALKAQAVAARSYYLSHPRGRHEAFDFCDTTHCQFLREPPPSNHPAREAALQTRGLVLSFQGKPVEALYSSRCGGRTYSLAEVGMQAEAYPYFPVECEWCRRHAERWEKSVDAQTAAALLARRSERGRIDLGRMLGWQAVPANDFVVSKRGDQWFVTGKGAGHGVGLCQRGAAAMAERGATFVEILEHYYPNTVLTPAR